MAVQSWFAVVAFLCIDETCAYVHVLPSHPLIDVFLQTIEVMGRISSLFFVLDDHSDPQNV